MVETPNSTTTKKNPPITKYNYIQDTNFIYKNSKKQLDFEILKIAFIIVPPKLNRYKSNKTSIRHIYRKQG